MGDTVTMWNFLAGFRVVLVSGPHRSGTTITTKMIASDLGYNVHLEDFAFKPDDVKAWCVLVNRTNNGVIQCPSMCYYLDEFGSFDDIAVCMMHRNIQDILASQTVIGWGPDALHKARYWGEMGLYRAKSGVLADIKHQHWMRQRERIKNAFSIEYKSLSIHPMWLPKERRVNFHSRQTEL